MSNLGVHELPRFYDTLRYDFMRPQGPSRPITESSVCIPPALWIHDSEGNCWTLGFDYDEREWRTGKWEYDCVRNGEKTGEFCRIIEMKTNSRGTKTVSIWGADGWRQWTGRIFV